MAVDINKPIYLFDQLCNMWNEYDYSTIRFEIMGDIIPTLTNNFAGIGTRDINDNGIIAIQKIYKKTFIGR